MANGYLKAAFESIPGNETNTPTLSTKVLYTPLITFTPTLAPNPLERDDELRNIDEPIAVIPDDYVPAWDLETRAYPDSTGYYLKNILGPPTTTAGNGVITDPDGNVVPTGAFRHVWTAPFGPSGFNPQTSELHAAYKDEATFFKLKGAASDKFAITTPDSGGARVKTSGLALFMTRESDPALSPTYESLSILPFERGDLQIQTWLGGTATTEDFDLNIDAPIATVSSLGITSRFPDVMEKGDGPILFHGSIPKREINATDYDALLNNTGFGTKVRWQSKSIITGAYVYAMWAQFLNCQYVAGGPNALANARRIGGSFDWKSTYNGTPGSSTVTLVNSTASYG